MGGPVSPPVRTWVGAMIALISDNRKAIADICRRYGVSSLEVFGSAATGQFREHESDVEFGDRSPGLVNRFLDLAESLERLLERPVDLMVEPTLENPYLRHTVNASREQVFGHRRRQAGEGRHLARGVQSSD
jgi:predicted nucleotidyltransferase